YNRPAFSGQNFTSTILQDLAQSTGGHYGATDGTGLINQWDLYNNDTTCGGPGCPLLLWAQETCDSWGFWGGAGCAGSGACNFGNRGEHVNLCDWVPLDGAAPVGVSVTHELGHCLYTMPDEYNQPYDGGNHCGHTVMNGPIWDNNIDYCTEANH